MGVSAVLPGLGFGLSLIVAIGAQNAFVLRQGIRGGHILAVIAVCTLSDVVLISAGIGGAGAFLTTTPVLMEVVHYVGGAFLLGYAAIAVRRALSPGSLRTAPDPRVPPSPSDAAASVDTASMGNTIGTVDVATAPAEPRAAGASTLSASVVPTHPRNTDDRSTLVRAVLTCLALTWLNPHVYLDTVILMGSFGNTYGRDRWAFAAGAMIASVLWFITLGYGSRLLAPVFARPAAWRVLDSVIALIMLALGVGLLVR
ncbi:LysE/ArgO family amino acid transporter [Nocardia wallacei]|uniref:LysE/ArgO family amino acid transporter n=1 Tax=Nocardia wallacei TaxID=480035 RepID=UPI0024541307|nr:LysE/ArgO family amino acid transporter [Nocardia wallacei]